MADRPTELAPLRYLSTAAIDACLPSVDERLELTQQALAALATDDAEMPPKLGVHPRDGALLHAMPAWLRSRDIVGIKWIAAFPGNRAIGVPAINGLVVLNDADTGVPTWIMDAARITAVRTAAVSGVAMRHLAPPGVRRVALLGTGVQAHSHLEVIAALLPEVQVMLHGRSGDQAATLAAQANELTGRDWVSPARSVAEAVDGAEIVVTVATLGARAERLGPSDVSPGALVVAVDFATYVAPELAGAAALFAVDDRKQFLHYRETGYFDGYPEPTTTLGELASSRSGTAAARGSDQPTLVTHLGVGLADVVLADAIANRAQQAGAGQALDR